MKNSRLPILLICCALPPLAAQPSWNLMPWPKKIEAAGSPLRIGSDFRVAFAGTPPPRLERAARRFVAQLWRETGIPITARRKTQLLIDCCTVADRADRLGDDESYTLDVSSDQARLKAVTVPGAMRGLATLLQLVHVDAEGFAAAPVHIEDSPRFPWRGLLIDVTSHFMPVAVIKRNLDAMEAVKLNVFHWHLTDDQGFRLESKVFPKLHTLGSGGEYYTRQDIREVIEYARDRGIRVVPEIDMPGHCATWLIGYPELASAPGPYSIIHTFGVYDPVLDPTQEKVYTFVDQLIGEITALFPDEYLHIGGDEVNGKHWKANPAIQRFIRQRGLKDEAGLQAYFNRRVEAIVRKYGRKMMGWDEVLHPDLSRDVLVQSWRDHESMAKAARQGHRALLSFGYYLDHLDSSKAYYAVDPLGGPASGLADAEAARVLGGEACMWTEFVSPETMDSRIWPMSAAIAERLWSPRSTIDLASMYRRLDVTSRRLDWRGVRHNLNYESMLQRLSEDASVEDLKVLADAVEPLGIDGREGTRVYSQSTALNRFVDAVRGENVVVRLAEQEVSRVLAGGDDSELRRRFSAWQDNAVRLGPHFASSALLNEAAPVSRALSRVGQIGLEALSHHRSRQTAPEWLKASLAELDRLGRPQAEVALAAVRPVRLLLLALQREDR